MDLLQRYEIHFPPYMQLSDDAVVLDLGAHNGLWTVEALKVWPNIKIIAVEPNPVAIRRLTLQLLKNNLFARCTIIPAAIGEGCEMAKLHLAPSGSWGNTLFDIDGRGTMEVPVVTLETILCGRIPALIKCNAEGAEFFAIRQLLCSNIRPKYLLLALHPEYGDVNQAISELAKGGYKLTLINHPGSARRPFYHGELLGTQVSSDG